MTDMIDMSQFVEAKSDQLNADDLIGAPRTITVRKVAGNDGDQPVSIYYEGDNNKPFKPCKTIRRVLLAVWGRNAADYVGRSMTIYRDDRVQFGGLEVGGIRISHMSHIDKETMVVVMKTKGKKAGIKIQPLRVDRQPPADRQPEPPEDIAAAWCTDFTRQVRACTDIVALEALEIKFAKRLAELRDKRPELSAQCEDMIAEQRTFLTPGRADTDMGDGFTDGGDE